MLPAARLSAALEILAEIESSLTEKGLPADVLVSNYFRARRYAGSKDRRYVSGLVYGVLRSRELCLWALRTCDHHPVTARSLLITYLAREEPGALDLFGAEGTHAPDAFDAAEVSLMSALKGLDVAKAPIEARTNIPEWAQAQFSKRFGPNLDAGAEALARQAPMDIRVNTLKARNLAFNEIMKNESELFEKNDFSDFGYRARGAVNLMAHRAYKDGLVEIQDEAAQVASSLVAAKPKQQVIDLCAGAGGKSLAIATTMANTGQIHAFDINGKRLKACEQRRTRAGVRTLQTHLIPEDEAGRRTALAPFHEVADRVLVDVPCTGSGTWRRSPDQRWRFDSEALAALNSLQANLLEEGAGLVKPGGRLLYMTCSVLPVENETIVQDFIGSASGASFTLADYRAVWAESLASKPVDSVSSLPGCLQMVPHVHDTDGFFVAILERTS